MLNIPFYKKLFWYFKKEIINPKDPRLIGLSISKSCILILTICLLVEEKDCGRAFFSFEGKIGAGSSLSEHELDFNLTSDK